MADSGLTQGVEEQYDAVRSRDAAHFDERRVEVRIVQVMQQAEADDAVEAGRRKAAPSPWRTRRSRRRVALQITVHAESMPIMVPVRATRCARSASNVEPASNPEQVHFRAPYGAASRRSAAPAPIAPPSKGNVAF